MVGAAEMLHGWVAWIPARLTAIGYAMAGSFDGALSAWRETSSGERLPLHEQSEQLLARVGVSALALQLLDGESLSARGVRGARAANGLVVRLLTIWAVVIGSDDAVRIFGAVGQRAATSRMDNLCVRSGTRPWQNTGR